MSLNHLNNEIDQPNESGFTVPEGYFDTLKNRIRFQTIEKEPLTLYTWPDDQYFNNLKSRILKQTTQGQSSLIIRLSSMPVFRYAAAALLFSGLYFTVQPEKLKMNESATAQMAPSNDEIINYLSSEGVNDLSLAEFVPVVEENTNPAGEAGETLILESL